MFVAWWYDGWFRMERFGMGRMQFELWDFPFDYYEKDGKVAEIKSDYALVSIGRRPRNSGIIPYSRKSSTVTLESNMASSSYLSLSSAPNPIIAVLFKRFLTIFSKSGKAPPQINKILVVLICKSS